MPKSKAFENALMQLIFNNVAIANIGDAAGLQPSAAAGSLYVSLHTANPGEAGDQSASEVAYTGYARAAVPRTVGGWTVVLGAAQNAAAILLGLCTAGGGTATHFAVGTLSAGAGMVLYYAALTASLAIAPPLSPEFPIGDLDVTEE